MPFGPDGNCEKESNQYHWQVHKRLIELNKKDSLKIEIVRQDTIMCDIIDPEAVREYGENQGADLVIYGNYQEKCEWDTTLLNVRYAVIKEDGYTPTSLKDQNDDFAPQLYGCPFSNPKWEINRDC